MKEEDGITTANSKTENDLLEKDPSLIDILGQEIT